MKKRQTRFDEQPNNIPKELIESGFSQKLRNQNIVSEAFEQVCPDLSTRKLVAINLPDCTSEVCEQ